MLLRLALLGTLAATPALAADRMDPHCSEYGAGFVYSPSSGFCVRLGGQIEVGVSHGGGLHTPNRDDAFGPAPDALGGQHDDPFGTSATLQLDARKATEYGPLRLYVQPRASVR